MAKKSDVKAKSAEISRRLIEHYGCFEVLDRDLTIHAVAGRAPFDVLIATILSQNTSDKNSHRAFTRLYSRYNTPEQLAAAPEHEIAELIKIGGLYEQKAKLIKEVAQRVMDEYDGSLDFVCDADPAAVRQELMSIKGIGPKTADCVLLFGCGRDVIPVDTHVFRITKRLGIVPEDASFEGVRRALMDVIPAGERGSVHVDLIRFGRDICRAQNPQHDKCFLIDLCDYARTVGAYPPRKK